MLPLDLHVLSLSLAFILSQDQTLHTKIILQKFSLAGSCVPRISTRIDSDSRSLRFVHLNILKNSFFLVLALLILRAKADAKIRLFFITFQIFFKVFSNFFFKSLVIRYFELLKHKEGLSYFHFNISRTLQETIFLASFMLALFLVLRVQR